MAIIEKKIDVSKELSEKQIESLKKIAERPIPADDEYPEFSQEELSQFKRISDERKAERQKQTVAIRLSQRSLSKAKSIGKGYTTVLGRILEDALNDPETIKRYL